MTVHPALQKFLVETSDECVNPGTMCASVIASGSRGMSKLHVCIDHIHFLFGRVMRIGWSAMRLFFTGAPSTKKCPVAPESDTACCTALVICLELKIVCACCDASKLLAWMMVFHA